MDKLFHFFKEGIRDSCEKSFHLLHPVGILSFQRNPIIIGIYNAGKNLVSCLLPSDNIPVRSFPKKVVSI